MRTSGGSAIPVFGVAGSATLGDAQLTGVVSSGCVGFCLFKTASSIVSASGSVNAPAGPALFSFAADSALVYFPHSRTLARFTAGHLDPIAFNIAGEILAIGPAAFVVRRPGGVWIVNSTGQPLDSLPRDVTAALLLDSGLLYATPSDLILRRPDRSEQSFGVAGVRELSWLGSGYVQIRTAAVNATYALRVDPGREKIFLLPDPQ